jgi:hypothetical protein
LNFPPESHRDGTGAMLRPVIPSRRARGAHRLIGALTRSSQFGTEQCRQRGQVLVLVRLDGGTQPITTSARASTSMSSSRPCEIRRVRLLRVIGHDQTVGMCTRCEGSGSTPGRTDTTRTADVYSMSASIAPENAGLAATSSSKPAKPVPRRG